MVKHPAKLRNPSRSYKTKTMFALTKHRFFFASSSEATGTLEVSTKALGDFTSTVGGLSTGTTVYVDAPTACSVPTSTRGPGSA